MRKITLFLALFCLISLGEILDPSFGSMRVLAPGWRGLIWNVAGLADEKEKMMYADVVYRFSVDRDEKEMDVAYLSGEENGLVGAVGIYRSLTANRERFGAFYAVAGEIEALWGIGVGIERIRDPVDPEGVYSVFLSLGSILKYPPFELGLSLRKLRIYSQRMNEYLIGDLGIGAGLDFGPVEFGLNVLMYNADVLRAIGAIELELGPVGMSLGGGAVVDLNTMNYTPRVEGTFYSRVANLGFGVYVSKNLYPIDVPDFYDEVELDTVLSSFFSFSW